MGLTRAAWRGGQLLRIAVRAMRQGGAHAGSTSARAQQLHAALAELVAGHGFRISVSGRWPRTPSILVANHLSYLDPILIGACLPLAPVAKAEVGPWPFIGPAARNLGAIFVDRADPHSGAAALRCAAKALDAGVHVLIFPEGTTTAGDVPLPFHLGAFGLAALCRVPVVPVAIRYASPELAWTGGATFLPHYLRTAARQDTGVRLQVGAPLSPRPLPRKGELSRHRRAAAHELCVAAHGALSALLRPPTLESFDDATIRHGVPAPRAHAVLSPARQRAAGAGLLAR